jgi:hypothetical protein
VHSPISALPYLALGTRDSRVCIVEDPSESLKELHRGVIALQLRATHIARSQRDLSPVDRLHQDS